MKKPAALVLLLSLVLAAGCSSSDSPQDQSAAPVPTSFTRLIPSPPPQAPIEIVPVNSEPQSQIWRPGHWTHDGNNFVWVEGVFMGRPSPTAAWSPDRWDRHEFGWAFVPGHWQ